jgi:NAD(P)-dependent dehydrogenase (short-subunit alcohol dehydrogenase family)
MIQAVLISGCTSGLGEQLALHFSSIGCHVYAVGRNEEKLTELGRQSPSIHTIVADITQDADRLTIVEHMKGVTFSVIHNAGMAVPALFKKLDQHAFMQHVETNFVSPLLLTQQLLPLLKPGQRILHITSGAATQPLPALLHYGTTKAAMQHALLCLDKELSEYGIRCGNLRPGLMDTPLLERWIHMDASQLPQKDFYIRAKANQRAISPSLVAIFVAWVLLKSSDDAFSQTMWNTYDEAQQHHWMPSGVEKPTLLTD